MNHSSVLSKNPALKVPYHLALTHADLADECLEAISWECEMQNLDKYKYLGSIDRESI